MNAKGIASKYIQEMVVGQPDFMAGADQLFAKITPAEYRDYMEWGIISGAAGLLNQPTSTSSVR